MLDPDGHIVNWNPGAERIKGYPARRNRRPAFLDVLHRPRIKRPGFPKRLCRSPPQTGKYEAEGWRVRKDESRFWASVVINAIKDADGEICGICQDHAGPDGTARGR